MSNRKPTLTKKQKRKGRARAPIPLIAAGVTGAPLVEELMRGRDTGALLMAMVAGSDASSPGWRAAQLVQTEPETMNVCNGAYLGSGIRWSAVPGSRIQFDASSAALYDHVGPAEIAVDDDGSMQAARVSTSRSVTACVYRYGEPPPDEQKQHGDRLAALFLRETGCRFDVEPEPERSGGRGVGGDPLTDVLLKASDASNIRLQMEKLDAGLEESIGQHKTVVNHQITADTILGAIERKHNFAGKDAYELVLTCPFDLGSPFRSGMAAQGFDTDGWARIWLSDSSSEPVVLGKYGQEVPKTATIIDDAGPTRS